MTKGLRLAPAFLVVAMLLLPALPLYLLDRRNGQRGEFIANRVMIAMLLAEHRIGQGEAPWPVLPQGRHHYSISAAESMAGNSNSVTWRIPVCWVTNDGAVDSAPFLQVHIDVTQERLLIRLPPRVRVTSTPAGSNPIVNAYETALNEYGVDFSR